MTNASSSGSSGTKRMLNERLGGIPEPLAGGVGEALRGRGGVECDCVPRERPRATAQRAAELGAAAQVGQRPERRPALEVGVDRLVDDRALLGDDARGGPHTSRRLSAT